MGYKNDDNCLAKVDEDEPVFVLRAQDKLAPALVELWASLAFMHGCNGEKLSEANELAQRMRAWQHETDRAKWPD